MNLRQTLGILGSLTLASVAAPAVAGTCYVVYDRGNTVIYQGQQPPVDLSASGYDAREAMRRRGEFMESFESQSCPERSARTRAGQGEASVDEIVAGIRPYQRAGRAGSRPDDDAGSFATPSSNAVQVRLGN
jgi:hypothetical protein